MRRRAAEKRAEYRAFFAFFGIRRAIFSGHTDRQMFLTLMYTKILHKYLIFQNNRFIIGLQK
jgi:hypothetical protein